LFRRSSRMNFRKFFASGLELLSVRIISNPLLVFI
jgi:hypothetical protein